MRNAQIYYKDFTYFSTLKYQISCKEISIKPKYWKPGVYVTSLKVNGRLVESTNFTILE